MKETLLSIILSTPLLATTTVFTNAAFFPTYHALRPYDWMLVENEIIKELGRGGPPQAEKRVDLKKRFVFPSLIDAHAHLTDIGLAKHQVDLRGAKTASEAAARVKNFISDHRVDPDALIAGAGWDQADWPLKEFPSRQLLDAISASQPIILSRVDGHAYWVNTFALKRSGLWTFTGKDPKGGRILQDQRGQPTGILIDSAMKGVEELIKAPPKEVLTLALKEAVEEALRFGITGVGDADASPGTIVALEELSKETPFRFYEFVSSGERSGLSAQLKRGIRVTPHFTVRTVKLYADGAMGSRGAAFDEPYRDDPSTSGLLQMEEGVMMKLMKDIDGAGFQIAVHAIGSKGVRVTLDALEKALGEKIREKRPRIEHAQVVTPALLDRMKTLGVIASMQPIHSTSDMKWVEARIGATRGRWSYAWASVIEHGIALAFGSDAPVDDFNPWHGVFAAITRQDSAGRPAGGFVPEERISATEALRAYTEGAAFAQFTEGRQGVLGPGAFADFVVLAESPLKLTPQKLRALSVQETFVGGISAYKGQ